MQCLVSCSTCALGRYVQASLLQNKSPVVVLYAPGYRKKLLGFTPTPQPLPFHSYGLNRSVCCCSLFATDKPKIKTLPDMGRGSLLAFSWTHSLYICYPSTCLWQSPFSCNRGFYRRAHLWAGIVSQSTI